MRFWTEREGDPSQTKDGMASDWLAVGQFSQEQKTEQVRNDKRIERCGSLGAEYYACVEEEGCGEFVLMILEIGLSCPL